MRHLSAAVIAVFSTFALTQIASAHSTGGAPAYGHPSTQPVYRWTGFYLGGNIGGGWSTADVNYTANDPATALLFSSGNRGQPPASSFKTSGVLGGLQFGYNYQVNRNWLVGLETDFEWSGMSGSATSSGSYLGIVPFTASADEHIRWFGTLRGRLGYLPTPNLLAYVTGGFAYGKVEHSGRYVDVSTNDLGVKVSPFGAYCAGGATCFAGTSSSVDTGWTLGAGLEYAVWQNWTLKAEYLYVSLDNTTMTETALMANGASTPASFDANFGRTDLNIVRVGVNYHF